MSTVGFLARASVRRQWRAILVVALLVGLAGTVVLGAIAGARRTSTALGRFEEQSLSAHAEISVGDPTPGQLREFREADAVGAVGTLRQLAVEFADNPNLPVAASLGEDFGELVDRPHLVAGRSADDAAVDEVAISEALADQADIGVGGRLAFGSFTQEQVAQFLEGRDGGPPAGPRVELRVVGIERRPLDLGARGADGGVVVLTPAFLEKYGDRIGSFGGTILRVRAKGGAAGLPHVTAAAREVFGESPSYDVQPLGVETEGARDAIDVLAVALWTFGAVAGVAGAVAIAIVLGRQAALAAGDQATLRALGMSRGQRAAAAAAAAWPVVAGGAVLAVVGAALASPLLPFGVARRAEADPGIRLDWVILGLGGLAVLALVVVVAGVAGLRVTRTASASTRIARSPRGIAVVPGAVLRRLPSSTAIGVRMAFEPGQGRTAVPVRSAFVGAALGALGVVAVLTFAASLHALVTTPSRYGWDWDLWVEDDPEARNAALVCGNVETQLARSRSLDAVTAVCELGVEVDGLPVAGYGFVPVRGTIGPTVVEGRGPTGPGEVALGASTLEALGKRIGDTVQASGEAETLPYRVVGTVVLPAKGATFEPQPLAEGAVFTGPGLEKLDEPSGDGFTDFVVRLASDVDRATAASRVAQLPGLTVLDRRPELPVEVERVRQVDWLPTVLAGFMGVLAVVAVGHALVTAVRRRRLDLAVLKTLGFSRRQVRATVAGQATALSAVGLVIGVPLGLVAGRTVWRLVAEGLGVAPSATFPVLAVVAVCAGGIALANLIAALPGRIAARTQPAVVLRSE